MGQNTGNLAYGGIQRSYSFGHLVSGQLVGALSQLRGPDQPCENVLIKADPDNTGNIWIGSDGVSSTTGYQLAAGDSVLLPIKNLNLLYYINSVVSERLHYLLWR